MSWLSSWLDKQGGVGKTLNAIAKPVQKVVNPFLDEIPGVESLRALGDLAPGAPSGEKGAALPSSGLSAKDWLAAISGAVGGGLDYKQGQAANEENVNRFARTQGQDELKTAANAQNLLNRAPMADNAQALLMARMGGAPTTFAPRDYTRAPMTAQTMAAPATGGPQDALASARTAAANYQPGQGGVDTSALEILKKRMFQNAKVGV